MKEKFLEQHGWQAIYGTGAHLWRDPEGVEINGTAVRDINHACLIQLERILAMHEGGFMSPDSAVLDNQISKLLASHGILLKGLQKIEGDFIADRPEEQALAIQEMRECAGEAISDAYTAWPGEGWKRAECE